MNNHDPDKKIHELEERISRLEKSSANGPRKFVWTALSIIIGFFIILTVIGVIQFVSAG
ncbi:hypothetical protein [Paenibacillus sp. FSL R7-0273]|uniref:hypothetical protein n=1 Tax=Paenibacillus sp. FSL R7-0273 TaxID=1536772 RepID=UPI0012E0BFD7|nr:hypothetical protein [Paenibacillus sp. FSL R7-0273]